MKNFIKQNIRYDDWLTRVNLLTETILDRSALSFEAVYWEWLYDAGIKPLEAVTALVEVLGDMAADEAVLTMTVN
jgi:hypothetical protein